MRIAVIDLGTNTFHLLIADVDEHHRIRPLHDEKQPARIGQGGISQGVITDEAFGRGLEIMKTYRATAAGLGIAEDTIFATATSAVRNARNGHEFVARIKTETGIGVEIISGDREAEFIYGGVKAALHIGSEPALIVDIGGGSVEFIIGNDARIFWKRSFEIGAQRLMDRFVTEDPMPSSGVAKLHGFLEEALLPLTNAVHQYAPQTLIGSAGVFDTLAEIHSKQIKPDFDITQQTAHELPLAGFQRIFQDLIVKNRAQRLLVPGMIPLRVDMIPVACCLVGFVLEKYGIVRLRTSAYALKEGLLLEKLRLLE